MSDPTTGITYTVYVDDWMYEISDWGESDVTDCCAIQYKDVHGGKTDQLNLGPPKHAREVAKAILAWCDWAEQRREEQ